MQTSFHRKPSEVPKYRHSKELQTAVQDDARRKAIDAVKKRAAAQNVDYPTFAALVSMAHVKPFERKRGQEASVQRIAPSPAWSFDATGKPAGSREASGDLVNSLKGSAEHLIRKTSSLHLIESEESKRPEEEHRILQKTTAQGIIHKEQLLITSDAFKREWRRSTESHDKLELLLAVSDHLCHIFKVELAPSLLTDIVNVLCWWKQTSTEEQDLSASISSCLEEAITKTASQKQRIRTFDVNLACCILESLVKCGRFSLSLKLAGSKLQLSVDALIKDLLISLGTDASCHDEDRFASGCSMSRGTDECPSANERGCSQNHLISIDRIMTLRSMYTI